MKIGVLIDRLNVGGVEKIAIEQVKALRSIGEDAYLVILRRKGVVDDPFPDLIKDIPLIYLDDRLPNCLKFSFKFPFFHFFSLFHLTYPLFIPLVVKKREFDYLISHGTYTSLTAMTIKNFNHVKFSAFIWDPTRYILNRVYSKKFSSHLFRLLKHMAKFLDKLIIDSSDVILAGGSAHNRYFRLLSPKKEIKIISPSIHSVAKISSHKEDYILMATAWKRGKNPEYIFELVKQLPKMKIKMVGRWLDRRYQDEFEEKIKERGLEKNIDIIGEVSEKDLGDYYSKALVFLQTHDDRGFGMPALEAAGHGTTFIIPQGQGVCNLFKDKKDGFFTREEDTEVIVKYLSLLVQNKKRGIEMGKHAWQTVRENYSWQKHAEKLKEMIEKRF